MVNLHPDRKGFTIVELLVVIVIIGILASITIVSYTGVANRAKIASLQSDLTNNAKKLQMYYAENSSYPITLTDTSHCPLTPVASSQYCLKANSTLEYNGGPTSFVLKATDSTISNSYQITEKGNPSISCPSGFIVVPGSTTYNTNDFCVMKYEAKQVGSTGVPESVATGTPWTSINQTWAISYSPNVVGCTGCHLITEAEWLTIAQNVLSVPANWSGDAVGNGYIYSGHNDNAPTGTLAASTNDSSGYYNETNTGGNQRRTLTLTNGEVIWDLAGNAWEWTSGQTTGGQPGITGESGYAWKEWNNATEPGSLPVNPFPSYGTTIANSWNATSQGIGKVYSSSNDSVLRGFVRGGNWYTPGAQAGVLALELDIQPVSIYASIGFRVAR